MTAQKPIRFLCGRAGSGKSTAVLDGIRQALAEGRQVYLIVPEQQAVVWERRAARELPPDAALKLEIVNFTRLENLVARTLGGLSYHYITKGGKAAMMWSTMRTLAPALSFYGGGQKPDRAVPAILSAVSEMKRCGITPAALSDAAEQLAQDPECARIAARAKDLAMITAAYGQAVRASYDDEEDALSHLAERLAETDFFAGAAVFVDSFFSLTPVENRILYHVFRQAEQVTVTFACLPEDGQAAHLAAPMRYLSAMHRAAGQANRAVETVCLRENHRARSAELAHLEENLWNFAAAPLPVPDRPDSVRMILAADRYEEAEAVSARILELVRGGARYSDIAVIARRADPIRGILDTALQRHGIPYFLSARSDIDTRPAARLMLCALAAASGGWRREDVLLAAKTGLCGLTDDECDAFEAYTETWHIRGARSFSQPWNMNPDGYVPTVSARGKKILSLVNAARDRLVPPLENFCAVFGPDRTAAVPEISRALYELLCAYNVWDALEAETRRLAARGESRAAAEAAQLWGILMEALDTLARTLPEARADASSYAALLRQVLGAAHVGAIPGGIDEVTVGEAHQVRLAEVPHVIVIGAVEGEFPAAPADDGFFSDTDRIRLEGAGIVLSGTSDDRMKEELFWFYRAAALPSDSLTVLLPLSDGKNARTPSMGAERILALLPGTEKEIFGRRPAADRIFSEASARAAVRPADAITAAALALLGFVPQKAAELPISAKNETVSEETAAALFGQDISLTQSRLDAFVLCRFGYYCKYAVRIEEPKEAQLTANTVGTFVHRVFELFFTRVKDRPLPLPAEEMESLTDEIVAQCVREIVPEDGAAGRAEYLFARLRRCVSPMLRAMSAEFAQSAFRPVKFELPVGTGDPDAVPALSIPLTDGRTVSLRGTVDRLDTWRDGEDVYVRVVDYKTGAKSFAPADLQIGLNVQLLLYLFSVLRAPDGPFRRELTGGTGNLRPAGALYFSARPGEVSSDGMLSAEDAARLAEESIDRSGILLADVRVLCAMETDLAGRFIPVKKAKNGSLGKNVRTAEEIAQIETDMCTAIAGAAEGMLSGDAAARPLDPALNHGGVACEYCQMKPVCRAAVRKEEITGE